MQKKSLLKIISSTYYVGLTHELFIFECLINNLMEVVKQCGVYVPLYIMTSEKNDEVTQKFFAEHNYFGYDKNYIKFFIQDMACAVDYNGKFSSSCIVYLSMSIWNSCFLGII